MIYISFIQDFLLEGGNFSGDNKLKQTLNKVFLYGGGGGGGGAGGMPPQK